MLAVAVSVTVLVKSRTLWRYRDSRLGVHISISRGSRLIPASCAPATPWLSEAGYAHPRSGYVDPQSWIPIPPLRNQFSRITKKRIWDFTLIAANVSLADNLIRKPCGSHDGACWSLRPSWRLVAAANIPSSHILKNFNALLYLKKIQVFCDNRTGAVSAPDQVSSGVLGTRSSSRSFSASGSPRSGSLEPAAMRYAMRGSARYSPERGSPRRKLQEDLQ